MADIKKVYLLDDDPVIYIEADDIDSKIPFFEISNLADIVTNNNISQLSCVKSFCEEINNSAFENAIHTIINFCIRLHNLPMFCWITDSYPNLIDNSEKRLQFFKTAINYYNLDILKYLIQYGENINQLIDVHYNNDVFLYDAIYTNEYIFAYLFLLSNKESYFLFNQKEIIDFLFVLYQDEKYGIPVINDQELHKLLKNDLAVYILKKIYTLVINTRLTFDIQEYSKLIISIALKNNNDKLLEYFLELCDPKKNRYYVDQ